MRFEMKGLAQCACTGLLLLLTASSLAAAQLLTAPQAGSSKQVTLYPFMQGKGALATDVTAPELSIGDAGRKVDTKEIEVSHEIKDDLRPVAFLFDRMDAASMKNAVRLAQRILVDVHEKTGASGLWALQSQLEVRQPYTVDASATARAIASSLKDKPDAQMEQGVLPPAVPVLADAKQELLNKVSADVLARAQRIVKERHVRLDMATLLAFAEAERLVPGRKAIVYFTEKEPADLNAVDDLKVVTQSLNDASTSLYVVDANPLDSQGNDQLVALAVGNQTLANHNYIVGVQMSSLSPSQKAIDSNLGLSPTGMQAMNAKMDRFEAEALQGNEGLLKQMAAATSGKSINEEEDAKKISRPLIVGLTNYCKVTYTISADQLDGKYHPVVLRVTQHGEDGISQLGYFMPLENGRSTQPRLSGSGVTERSEVDSLIADATGEALTFHAGVLRFGRSSAGAHDVFALEVPVEDLELREDFNTGLFSLHASVAAEVRDSSGEPVARFAEEFRPHGSLTTEASFRTQVLSTERAIDLPAGEYTLVAVVRDWSTGRIGSIEQRFDTKPGEGDARLSDAVLVRSTEGGGTLHGAAAMQYGLQRVVPNLSGVVRNGSERGEGSGSTALFFELYPDAGGGEPSSLYLEVSHDGGSPTKLPLQIRSGAMRRGSAEVASVNFGRFVGDMHVVLCMEQGDGKTLRRDVAFKVAEATGAAISSVNDESKPRSELNGANAVVPDEPRAKLFDVRNEPAAHAMLSPKETEALVVSARNNALSYAKGLPNFLCLEAIERSTDVHGNGSWKHRDSIVELLRYQDHSENRSVLEVDGAKSSLPADQIDGARSVGEFGSMLAMIFEPAVEAKFVWEKTEEQDGEVLEVFSYKVDLKHSAYYVSDHKGEKIRAPFQGLISIDHNTGAVRRLIAKTEELPVRFGVRSSWMAMNYDYIAINQHDYLLPTRGEVGLVQGKQQVTKNELRFSDYRRFGSRAKIVYGGPPVKDDD